MRRKFLSVVLCVCMMLTMAPFAFAAGTDTGSNTEGAGTSTPANSSSGTGGGAGSVSTSTTNAITNETDLKTALNNASDGDTITISDTIYINAPLVITKTVTLTGGSITASDSFTAHSDKLADKSLISLKIAGKVLTLKDITLDAKQKTLVVFSNAGKVVVDGATITGGKTNSSVAGVYMTNASEFEMTSGSISSNEVGKTDYSKYAADLWVGANAKATLSGGKIDNIFVNANSFSENNPGYFKMQDGHVTNLYAEYYENYGATVIYDGGTLDNLYISTTASNGACENVTPVAGMTYKGGQTDAAALTPVAKVDAKKFTSLADAIATADNKTVILLKDVTEDVVIPSDKTVTLNLNGKKLTNVSSDTITVANGANLTITGEGTVDNVTHAKAAIYNKGTVTLNGGTYDRSNENGVDADNAATNTYYTILNHGKMTVDSSVTVRNKGHHSSLFENGYYSHNSKDGIDNPTLTITSGTYEGGLNTIKNDDDATLTINGGTFTNYTQAAFQNHGTATVTAGSFIANSKYAIDNCGCDATNDPGKLKISGGTFNGTLYIRSAYSNVTISDGYFNGSISKTGGTLTITGGYFTTDPSAYCVENKTGVATGKADYPYTVGDKKADSQPATVDSATVPANTTSTDATVIAAANSISGASVTNNNATEAATRDIANNNTITATTEIKVGSQKKTVTKALSDAMSEGSTNKPSETNPVAIVYQTYVDVTVTDAKKDSSNLTELTVNLTPMYRVVATTKNVTDIKVKGDSGVVDNEANAILIENAKKLNVPAQAYEVTLALPSGFAIGGAKLSIKHTKGSSVEYYTGTVSEASSSSEDPKPIFVTFTTNGFSPFVIYAASANVASIGDDANQKVYPTLQAAIDAVQNNETITLLKATNENVTVSKAIKFTLAGKNYLQGSIVADSRYSMTTSEPSGKTEYTFTYVGGGSSSSISTPTTYAVNVNAATNGAVAADKKTASKGTTVTVTASPSKGYVVDAVKVVDKDGKDVAVTEKDGKYVFTMPASAVTVTGSFKAETPAPVALPFTDVKSGNWFYDAVKYAYAQGLMTGTSATTFAPNGTMNRAMIVTVLYRLEKSPAVTGASKFTDVPAGQWYSDAVAWAAANKIVNGYDETTFGPMNAVTREQMAAILFRYEQVKGLENVTLEENLNRFPDQNKISAYAIPALQWAVGQKIINGNADGTLDPTGTATRAQVAQIFTNLLNK